MSILTTTHPPGFTNPVILRASAALPAAGAWDAVADLIISSSAFADFLTLAFTYTRGGAGGAFDWQLWTSIYAIAGNVPAGAQEWQAPPIYSSGAVVAGADTTSNIQRELITYQATGAAVEVFTFGPTGLRATIERIRVRARESGAVGTPGTLQIAAELV
jgi:hypothetical protein